LLPTIPLDYNVDFVMCEGGDRGSKKSQIADIMGCGFLMRPTLLFLLFGNGFFCTLWIFVAALCGGGEFDNVHNFSLKRGLFIAHARVYEDNKDQRRQGYVGDTCIIGRISDGHE
jgi:hypothetical protein